MPTDDEIRAILDGRLGQLPETPSERAAARLRKTARMFGVEPRTSVRMSPEVAALLQLVGASVDDLDKLDNDVTAVSRWATAAGGNENLVPTIGQAYARGISRIVAAEAEVLRLILHDVAPEERAQTLDDLLGPVVPMLDHVFAVLHRAMLRDALSAALASERVAEPAHAPLAIAHVDVVASTVFLTDATAEDTEHLVDVLFASAQGATVERDVQVAKYVGDGVFLAGADVAEVARASLDIIDAIPAAMPLEARAGLAYGPVVRRAGDQFGLVVNLAELLTKATDPGTLLVTMPAAELLPEAFEVETRRVQLPRSRRRITAASVRPATATP